ncbi:MULTISPECIES: hypothetical protein [Actinoplanes]|uniref:hypothetical protein n=1 Tax=Actinoplanes TaxID=1865 RepID=UPI000ACDC947|nr:MULTISPECIES: hypothetical protein [Actinoplanes]GLY06586.1 hypothetical protein Acsp01_69650 [Actinoplanes sp. NBRC 101535]
MTTEHRAGPVAVTVDAIVRAVLAVPGVVRLHGGPFGEAGTYLPGRRVPGIRLGDDRAEVHVTVTGRVPLTATARLVHAAVAPLVTVPVHVRIEDVVLT